jgi:hypothetical protein
MSKFASLFVLLVAGCDSDAPFERSEPPAKTAHISSLITGSEVTLPAEVQPFFGMTLEDYKKTTTLRITGSRSSDTVGDASYSLYYKDGAIAQIELSSDAKLDLRPILTAKWGEPVRTLTKADYPRYTWTNTATKMKAAITENQDTASVRFGFLDVDLTRADE